MDSLNWLSSEWTPGWPSPGDTEPLPGTLGGRLLGENSNEAESPIPFFLLGSNSLEWLQTVSYYICQMLFQESKGQRKTLLDTRNQFCFLFTLLFLTPSPPSDHT